MNKNIKTYGAALLAAVMCAFLAGCAGKETPNTGKPASSANGNTISGTGNQSSTASKPESENASDNNSTSESPSSASNEITITATDEILNAKFDSGLVQWYNDLFQCGGYLTVSEFIEKYKSSYDFTYDGDNVDTDILNKALDSSYRDGEFYMQNVYLRCMPKFTVKGLDMQYVIAYIVNPSENPVQLSNCYINYVATNKYVGGLRAGGFCAGYCDKESGKYFLTEDAKKNKVNEKNPDFIETDVAEYLRSLGYEEINISSASGNKVEPSMEYNNKYFMDRYGNYFFYNVGEPNAFGARPFYRNCVSFTGEVDAPTNVGYIFE